ncbi:ABC transporter substrate-binding protein [Teichococcus cervicalis]|uniref:Tat pathway signal sequence domain protein n=1 Tax=Pseudoroseomonas cervicalis ATCC 49957 TaxID=525371 RepID=D5RJU3_9PROT|nr:ABC transporter substrate-binding protein [Pseudoroseomonas cervicalis]EFH12428.1 Tat pathway signal sequence domain protein [Pseudoroseomonas cervicalis ATCC 49957]
MHPTLLTRRRLALGAAALPLAGLARPVLAQPAADQFRLVTANEINGLDPARSGYVFSRMQVAETLLGADAGGRPVPMLATGWTLSEDRLEWRFALRPTARFQDGSPVTAEAVAACLQRAARLPGPLASAPLEAIRAEGSAVLIRTTRPFLSLTAFLAHYSTLILAPAAFEGEAVRSVIGSGPYQVARLLPPQRLEVERSPHWDGPPPAIARASYLAAGRGETRSAMAESGQAEFVTHLAPETVERLRRNPRVALDVQPIPRTRLIKLNCALPVFRDADARRALSLALDRAGMAAALLRSPASTATQLFPPTMAEWHVPSLPPLRRDLAEARRLLAGLGWAPGAEGILHRQGAPFRFTLRTFSDRPELPGLATAMQAQLREIGIDMQVAIVNSGEIPAGHRDGTLEAALMARNFSLVPDPLGTLLQDYGPQGGDWGAMNWSSPELASVLERLGAEADPAARAALRGRVSTILQQEMPVIPVSWFDLATAVSRRVADIPVDPLELSYRIAGAKWAG